MPDTPFNKFRAASEILLRGRDVLVEALADEILDRSDDLTEGGFAFNEFLEGQGTRVHFLCLLLTQLEQSAEMQDERNAVTEDPPMAPPKKKRTPRSKKNVTQTASSEGTPDDA